MAQTFGPGFDLAVRGILLGLAVGGALGLVAWYLVTQSSYATEEGRRLDQPVPFSHKHHVGGLGISCQYCHTSAEQSAFAGVPQTRTCMTCHSQLWTNAPMLEPVRESLRTKQPLRWKRVHDLADFVYFDHSMHVDNGVGCASCHGRVDEMALMRQEKPLTMSWCLDCHRNPAPNLRPKEQIYNLAWKPPPGAAHEALGRRLMQRYDIHPARLTNCTVCHR